MTIRLSLRRADDLSQLARDVYQALTTAGCPDLASEAACMVSHARDATEYVQAVLRLADDLVVEWEEARP
jgi:hypothetical protein